MQTYALHCSTARTTPLGKGNCPMENPVKKLLTCGASYKPPALPGDTYHAGAERRAAAMVLAKSLESEIVPEVNARRRGAGRDVIACRPPKPENRDGDRSDCPDRMID